MKRPWYYVSMKLQKKKVGISFDYNGRYKPEASRRFAAVKTI